MNLAYPTLPNILIAQGWGNHNPMRYPGSGRHMGIDLAGPVGTAIYAACPGVVEMVNLTGAHGYGRHVVIEHGDFRTLYAHLSKVRVQQGQVVEAGTLIGEMGGDPTDKDPIDGASSGPHLHFEVILPTQPEGTCIKTVLGWTVDPFAYLLGRFGAETKFKGRVLDKSGSRVRSSPSTRIASNVLYAVKQNETIEVVEVLEAEGDMWARLKALRPEYAAVTYQGRKYLELAAAQSQTKVDPQGDDKSQTSEPVVMLVDERSIRLDEVRKMLKYLQAREKELDPLAPLSASTQISPQMEERNLGRGS